MALKDGFERCKEPTSSSGRQTEEDQPAWTIPAGAAVAVSDSDVESVDVLRFDEPEGRASWIAGEPPPAQESAVKDCAAVLAAYRAATVPAGTSAEGKRVLPSSLC